MQIAVNVSRESIRTLHLQRTPPPSLGGCSPNTGMNG